MNTPRVHVRRTGVLIFWSALVAGCGGPAHERVNAPPQGDTQRRSRMQHDYAYMSDNAMLQEMCLYDGHFVPNQAVLSGTGEARLERYAELLSELGGTLNYVPPENDPELTSKRVDMAKKFLADASHGGQKIDVQVGMPRGFGADAAYATKARQAGMTVFAPTAPSSGGGGTGTNSNSGGANSGSNSAQSNSQSTGGGGG